MPQNGFHGLVGLAIAKPLARRVSDAAAASFAGGLVIGAMFPDIDMYPMVAAVLMHVPNAETTFHRTATHSVWAVLIVAFLGLLASVRRRNAAWVLWGLAIGMSTHIALDSVFWFAQLDLFWPLSHGDHAWPIVNVWDGYKPPSLLVNIREAFEPAAFALLIHALRRIVGPAAPKHMRTWEIVLWGYSVVALITAFVFHDDPRLQNYVVTTPYLLAFLPYCWWQVWSHRAAIARWSKPTRSS